MEFATEEEAREYFGESYGYYTPTGFNQLNKAKWKLDETCKCAVQNEGFDLEQRRYVVYTYVNNSYLYVQKVRGVTYIQSEAKLFNLKQAKDKVKYMNRSGVYTWNWMEV